MLETRINNGPGVAGYGIYAFRMKEDSETSILEAWKSTKASGYNKGVVFVLEALGIVDNAIMRFGDGTGRGWICLHEFQALAAMLRGNLRLRTELGIGYES